MLELFVALVAVSFVVVIIVILVFRRAIMKSKIWLWAILLLTEFAFSILAVVIATVADFPPERSINMVANLNLIFFMIAGIMLFSKHYKVISSLLWTVFLIFIAIWIVEFFSEVVKTQSLYVPRLAYASMYKNIVFVIGASVYIFTTFKSGTVLGPPKPFFLLCLGWYIYFLTESATMLVDWEIVQNSTILPVWASLCELIANTFYALAFIRTKTETNWE
jgi:uncharacterized membrane protein YoaK (UPF0700 family)